MKTATISETKNKLSELLAAVRAGETLTILDRKRPIARVEAVRDDLSSPYLSAPRAAWDPRIMTSLPLAEGLRADGSLINAVVEERESGW